MTEIRRSRRGRATRVEHFHGDSVDARPFTAVRKWGSSPANQSPRKETPWTRTASKERPRKSKARSRTTRAVRPRARCRAPGARPRTGRRRMGRDQGQGRRRLGGREGQGRRCSRRRRRQAGGRPRVEEHEFDRMRGVPRGASRRFSAAAAPRGKRPARESRHGGDRRGTRANHQAALAGRRPSICRPRVTQNRTLPLLALVGVTAVWGLTFVQVQDALALYPLFAFLAVRFAISTVVLAPFAWGQVRALPPRRRDRRRRGGRAARRRLRISDGGAGADHRLEHGLHHRSLRRLHPVHRARPLRDAGASCRLDRGRVRRCWACCS